MATQFCDSEGQLFAVRRSGGEARGVLVELQVDTERFHAAPVLRGDDGSTVTPAELAGTGTVVEWSRLRARAMACELARLARAYGDRGWHREAYACAAAATRVRVENRC
jgi:hypothetical protein